MRSKSSKDAKTAEPALEEPHSSDEEYEEEEEFEDEDQAATGDQEVDGNRSSSGGEGTSDDDDEGEEDIRETLRNRLLAMKPEKVAELKAKLGEELFKKTFSIANSVNTNESKARRKKKKTNKKPREMSSKKPVSAFRRVVDVSKPKSFDPRFTESAGEFDDVSFRRDYAFIDELRAKEIRDLRKAHRELESSGAASWKLERLKTNLLRLENQQKAADAARLKIELNAEMRAENIERMNRGERPVYLNNQQMRNQFLTKKQQQDKKRKREMRKSAPSHVDGFGNPEKKPKLDPTKLS